MRNLNITIIENAASARSSNRQPEMQSTLRLLAALIPAGAACLLFSGCAATQVALEHHSLKVQTCMSHTIYLDAEKPSERTVLLDIKNTSDKNVEIEGLLRKRLEAKGYTVVSSPEQASYILQANVLRVGLEDPSALRVSSYSGTDAVAAGAAGGAAIGSAIGGGGWNDASGYGGVIGGVAAGAVDLVSGSLVKNVTYSMITDVQIMERTQEKVDQTINSNLEQGSGTHVTQTSSSERERRRYQTRIVSTANRVNLSFAKALPILQEQLAQSIAGIM
jgi:hypothetical protein